MRFCVRILRRNEIFFSSVIPLLKLRAATQFLTHRIVTIPFLAFEKNVECVRTAHMAKEGMRPPYFFPEYHPFAVMVPDAGNKKRGGLYEAASYSAAHKIQLAFRADNTIAVVFSAETVRDDATFLLACEIAAHATDWVGNEVGGAMHDKDFLRSYRFNKRGDFQVVDKKSLVRTVLEFLSFLDVW